MLRLRRACLRATLRGVNVGRDEVGAVVLTGGQSRRMGSPKEWLMMGDHPLLVRVVQALQSTCAVTVVVARPGQCLPALAEHVVRVDDPPARLGQGPLAALCTGLEVLAQLQMTYAVIMAVDSPGLARANVHDMLERLHGHAQRDAVVPFTWGTNAAGNPEQRVHGLTAAVRVHPVLYAATAMINEGSLAVRTLYHRVRTLAVLASELPEPRAVVHACNTPQDWAAWRACPRQGVHA